jgi:hypothetical protein
MKISNGELTWLVSNRNSLIVKTFYSRRGATAAAAALRFLASSIF